jgi:crotonobetainyl-CoA:carnitine CoA-transferase CaiB-like acyl-CoA transferase
LSPSGSYDCSDGSLALVVRSHEQRQGLLSLTGAAPDSDDEDLVDAVAAWTRGQDAESAAGRLREAGVSAERLRRPEELQRDPHLRARGFFEEVATGSGLTDMPGPAFRFSLTPAHTRLPAPALGEHNDYVLRELLRR